MKKIFLAAIIMTLLTLCACDLPMGQNVNFDNEGLREVEGHEGYYTDPELAFCAEIRGSYKSDRPFTLDEEDESLRIWDDFYLYEYDYFQLVSSVSADLFYSVLDEDTEYVTCDDKFAQATVNEGASGIYKITFDLDTKLFDLEYKGEITEPVYEVMDGCDVYSLKSEFTEMTTNPDNPDELMIKGYEIEAGALISFHNHGSYHLSNYKVILDPAAQDKYAAAAYDGVKHITFLVGGIYNLYVNPVSYEVRVELQNPDTANYVLYVFTADGDVELIADNPDTPYIFHYRHVAKKNRSVPYFAGGGYAMLELEVVNSDYLNDGRFIKDGTYDLEINLKTFTVTAYYISE